MIKKIIECIFSKLGSDKKTLKEGGITYFKNHVMDPNFDHKKYSKDLHPYLLKWGLKYSNEESEYYAMTSGVKSDYYIPTFFFYNLLCPYINKMSARICFQDKNTLHKILGAYRKKKKQEFRLAKLIAYNMNGHFYNGDDEPCTKEEAIRCILDYPKDLILKPSLDTTWGKGVRLVKKQDKTEDSIRSLMNQMDKNYNFQEVILQHHLLASFNPSSLNTIRVQTYRRQNGSIRVVQTIQRFGNNGSVVDNASAGGGFVTISPDGKIKDRKIRRYSCVDTNEYLDDSVTTEIPFFDRIKAAATYLHESLPYFNWIGWDMTVTEDGTPYVVEFNTKSAIEFVQIAGGPAFTKEELDELMPKVLNYYTKNSVITNIFFPENKHENKDSIAK